MEWSKYESYEWTTSNYADDHPSDNVEHNWYIQPFDAPTVGFHQDHPTELIHFELEKDTFNASAELARIYEIILDITGNPPESYAVMCAKKMFIAGPKDLSDAKKMHNAIHEAMKQYFKGWITHWGELEKGNGECASFEEDSAFNSVGTEGNNQRDWTDYNGDGKWDLDEGEMWGDWGFDWCPDSLEDGSGGCLMEPSDILGYDPNGDNIDPTGDDWNPIYLIGSEGNSKFDFIYNILLLSKVYFFTFNILHIFIKSFLDNKFKFFSYLKKLSPRKLRIFL